MTTISDLTPVKLSVADVGAASTAMAHAAYCRFAAMRRVVQGLPEDVARDLWLSAEILTASLAHRAWGRGRPTPALVALAALTPDDLRLPKEES